jgi:hypothetical protein
MQQFLTILGGLSAAFAVLVILNSASAVHEILAGVAITVTAVSWSGAAIVSKLADILKAIQK